MFFVMINALEVFYEDENLLIVDKESGVNSEAVFAALARERECYFIHRLDRNTQGLMAFALNVKTEQALLQAFQDRKVEKVYHALCVGDFCYFERCCRKFCRTIDFAKSFVYNDTI